MFEEAINYFKVRKARHLRTLENCKAKQNRLPEEENNIKKKVYYTILAIKALEQQNADGCSDCYFADYEDTDYPCKNCKHNHMSYWRPKI